MNKSYFYHEPDCLLKRNLKLQFRLRQKKASDLNSIMPFLRNEFIRSF